MNKAQLDIIYADIAQLTSHIGHDLRRLGGQRVLITGASSYVTSYMVDTIIWLNEHWLKEPCEVIVMMRSPVSPQSRLGHLLGRDDITFLQQSVADPIQLDRPADYIIHAASNASPQRYLAEPIQTMDANVEGTRQLLELAQRDGVKSMLFFSSSEIYGDVPDAYYPTPETYFGMVNPTAPRACYAESKRYGETLCATFWRKYGIPVKIARIFYVYGPGLSLNDGRVIADLMQNRLESRTIRLLSDGRGVRAFCYTSDAVAGFWQLLLSEENGEAFNIGNDQTITMRELAHLVSRLDVPELTVEIQEHVEQHLRGAPSRVCPDISKARERLGYAAQIDLEEGLSRLLRWYQAG